MNAQSVFLAGVALSLLACPGVAQPPAGKDSDPPAARPPQFPPGPQGARQPGDGPWNRDVIAYRVSNSGAVEKVATFGRAGVPTIARLKDGRLIVAHQHFPEDDRASFDKVAVRFSGDDGKTWTAPQVIRLDGLPEGNRFPFDPTLVPLPDGRVRLYFTSLKRRPIDEEQPAIYSAISDDGVDYRFEPGKRFGVEGRPVIDCAVVLHQGVFHLYAPDNGTQLHPGPRPGDQPADARPRAGVGYHATSRDGLEFARAADVRVDGRRRWLGNAQSDGTLITFFGTGDPGPPTPGPPTPGRPRGSLWLATSADGDAWQPATNPVISGGDPGAVRSLDGGWIVVITGEPRPGTPGARPNRPPPIGPPGQPQFNPLPAGTTAAMLNQMWSQGMATGEGRVKLQGFPLRLEDIGTIIPMDLMQSGHTTPSDHLYLVPSGATNPVQGNTRGQGLRADDRDFSRLYDVVAVADGFVVTLQWRPNPTGGQGRFDPTVFDRAVDLKVVIEHSATCWSYVDHLVEVDESIMKQVNGGVQPGTPVHVRIPVRAGQVIGKVGNQTLDFALMDTTVMRKGFVKPEQFLRRDPWKPHTVDPFDYIDAPLRGQHIAKGARKVAPFGGRIDYDVDGKLAGNWFEQGTGGYAGLDRRIDYWVGHLSFAYHHLDPKIIVVSIGNYDGRASQFWVKGNAPDPASIGEGDGVVKYELIRGQLGSSGQPQRRPEDDDVQGTVLAEVMPGRKLKLEAFPGKTASEISGFTASARTYDR